MRTKAYRPTREKQIRESLARQKKSKMALQASLVKTEAERQNRVELVQEFKVGDVVSDSRRHGVVVEIDQKTGELLVKFATKTIHVSPRFLTKVTPE